ncbi:MAG: SDR family NAD(P)-dependent oxidoreductase, partial [Sphaerospermopsis sp.]|nr:SDR family NAD(P)-dependent oxidoreductase [Sphaerospermopsis sp.]
MTKSVYLITGTSSGIGYAIARHLLIERNYVVGVSRSISPKLEMLIETYPSTYFHQLRDLSIDIDDLPDWVRKLSSEYGKFAGLVHSAGIQQTMPLASISYNSLLSLFEINVFAALSLAKGVSDRRSNIGEGTSIVFLSSIAAINGA